MSKSRSCPPIQAQPKDLQHPPYPRPPRVSLSPDHQNALHIKTDKTRIIFLYLIKSDFWSLIKSYFSLSDEIWDIITLPPIGACTAISIFMAERTATTWQLCHNCARTLFEEEKIQIICSDMSKGRPGQPRPHPQAPPSPPPRPPSSGPPPGRSVYQWCLFDYQYIFTCQVEAFIGAPT